MPIHAASIESPRLKRLLAVLADGGWHSTLELQNEAHLCAPGTCVSELRARGVEVDVELRIDQDGRRRWYYRRPPQPQQRELPV